MWEGVIKGVCMSKQEVSLLKVPLVYAEIMSFIKGSAEALEAGGHLSEAQYLEVKAQGRCIMGRVPAQARLIVII